MGGGREETRVKLAAHTAIVEEFDGKAARMWWPLAMADALAFGVQHVE